MPKMVREKSFAERGWVKAALLLLSALLLILLGRREDEEKEDTQPVIWRRDIEMGPTGEGGQERAAPVREQQPAPETRAGAGLMAETDELGEETGRAPVEGPIPLPEDEDDAVEMQTPAGDDLTIVEGIGPKINSLLHEAGIRTFFQLAEATPERLEEVLRQAGLRLANPETWPEQARLASEAEWSKLESYQKRLKGGRRG